MTAAAQSGKQTFSLDEFKKRAGKFDGQIALPQFETTTNEVFTTVKRTIAEGNSSLDTIGSLNAKRVSFKNTVGALDDIAYQIGLADNRLTVIKETSPGLLAKTSYSGDEAIKKVHALIPKGKIVEAEVEAIACGKRQRCDREQRKLYGAWQLVHAIHHATSTLMIPSNFR